MVRMCSIPLCKGVTSKQHNVKLHKFAASEKLRHTWLHRIKSYYPNFKISNSSLVCSKHFSEIDFTKNAMSETFSLHKDAVPSLFDVDECVLVFNDSELNGGFNIPIPSIVEVMEVKQTEMSDISNISGRSNIDVLKSTQSLDFQVLENPKSMRNATNNAMERKILFGDFKADDLNTPRKLKQYWDVSQQIE
ncbi:uncharacterized protein LOC103308103 isoform X2 [Acyrthosiphon pisum]|uniref:THAP-type domain-containing protein n=1 Tax=Acyrthosiphon pisum TaxID=7029 RepID=A0A8R2H347_ACYPI|nr:uncharacterized protein LOC103308103 isoform X2 [Acyrthosiphon pisum]|eukprot:XP_016657005.1 PREDICTED: uncharacterized protein LOC103308103 isoform X2 [Acyrthosiphon pisum]